MGERTVWKYLIPFRGGPASSVPKNGNIVHCGADPQTGEPALWIEADPSAAIEQRQFVAVATGGAVPTGGVHCGTAICGAYVWHVYETGLVAVARRFAQSFG